jgi:hypothetical protein
MIWLRKFVDTQSKLPWPISDRKIEKKAERENNNTYFVIIINTFLLIFFSLMTFSFFKHIQWRGGFDWDELYLVRAASMENFFTQLIPEPTPPLQAMLFKLLVSIGIPPNEMFMRLPNVVVATTLTVLIWKITHKYKLQLLLLFSLILTFTIPHTLVYVAVARPYFIGYFTVLFFTFTWYADRRNKINTSKKTLIASLLASTLHIYGGIVCTIIFLLESLTDRKLNKRGLISAIAPYSFWLLISSTGNKDKVSRVLWMKIPDFDDFKLHVFEQLLGGIVPSVIITTGILFLFADFGNKSYEIRKPGLMLLASFLGTIIFAYFFSYIIPIWYPRNFLFCLPLLIFSSSLGYYNLFSGLLKKSVFLAGTVSLLIIISISPIISKVLFDEVNSMSPGKYRDTSENIVSKEILEKRMIIIGWEDTKVYEFYFSTLRMGEGFNLKFKSRFDQDFSVEEKANLLILSSDVPISPEYTTWLSNKGFFCSDIGLTNRKIIKCDYKLISTY